jgi:hypothetical protein
MTFDPIDPATLPDPGAVPPPLEADLSWALPIIAATAVIVVALIGLSLRRVWPAEDMTPLRTAAVKGR